MTSFWIGMSKEENKAIREQQIDIRLNGWYYLGASGDPKLIKVLRIFGDMFEYMDVYHYSHLEGKPSRIETRIGKDLIAMAMRTMRKQVAQIRKSTDAFQQEYADKIEYTLDRHDLPEETKQDIDLTQAESEVYTTDEAKARKSNLEYMIEDAMREQENPEHSTESSIASVLKLGKVCSLYLLWLNQVVTFYPDGDYAWGEDKNVYPFDTIVHEQSEDDYEAAVLDRLCYKLPASEKMHIMNSEMDLPIHAARNEAFIVTNYIAGACGYTARRIDDDQIQTWVNGKRYLLTWDNDKRLFVSWQRDDQ